MDAQGQYKVCAICGRTFGWRKRWADAWDAITRCSDRCRERMLDATDHALEQTLLELTTERSGPGGVDPVEVARAVGGDTWKTLLERSREAARRLTAAGLVEIVQGGRVVDPSSARGPIRVRRRRPRV
jgi:hypothetical protein